MGIVNNIDNELLDILSQNLDNADVYAAIALGKISATITKKRASLSMNQKQFAEYMGVSQAMISKWESGDYNFTIQTIANISNKLNYSFEIVLEEKKQEYVATWDFIINGRDPVLNIAEEDLLVAS